MTLPFLPNAADATISDQADPDTVDFAILLAAHQGIGVVTGCAVTADPVTPDMTVDVAAGSVAIGSSLVAVSAQAGNAIAAADATNLRIDLITVNSSGTVVVTTGTPAATPVSPAIPATSAVLAMVYVPANDTAITDAQIVDKRATVARSVLASVSNIYDSDGALRLGITAGGDLVIYDEDGTTARLTWDESASQWVLGANLAFDPWTSGDYLYIETKVVDEAARIRIWDDSAATARSVIIMYGPEAATAGDIVFAASTGGAAILQWDESNGYWITTRPFRANEANEYAAARTLDWSDSIVNMDSSVSTRAVTLPDNATYSGKSYYIHRDGANTVTITRAGTDTFDDAATSKTLGSDGASIGFFSIGDGEWKIAGTSGTVT